ncbi:MAG: excinuclease ABC subunit UvrA [Caldiserica bacterium CG02_land_8_20_14_3_00_36_38]|nr:excinuclease ABC subunit UvrA [Caldisericota bacterium]OIP13371.1 MAG: excinuclease ABC subunit A [Caldisericum sp. CG2_30_36_11]PIP49752.1 MAG: excinuclease ABC subunit A [Caldiserica bacterium CG23_combo_of_CG06-09_8_20_14_all_35_60]PIV56783.1 MAG: excinuclease ABC subunit UvrA [Caldiserica bacterium CG02_land_8_20_14_3_00_36_38]PIX29884.1 MAG: excinuclease ABC subunit UvrA [Caldiserica bacterium CG_4_8_14_3_um_filter_35_18]
MKEEIYIKGARVHNLKDITLHIPRNKLVVITGVSGSGKSSLAFDTIYAEGQRRYVESLSAYARQFIGVMEKPDVDFIEGLSPAIAIDQKGVSKNPRSTVGTMTEIYDYLRLLYARIGIPHCPNDGTPIKKQSPDEIVSQIMGKLINKKIEILAPVIRGRKGEYKALLEKYIKKGYARVKIDRVMYSLDENIEIDKNKKHDIDLVVDRVKVEEDEKSRIEDSVELALTEGEGVVKVFVMDDNKETLFSEKLACPVCGFSMEEIEPRLFSFNSPFGACPECTGLGFKIEPDPDLIVRNWNLSLAEGAIKIPGFRGMDTFSQQIILDTAKAYHIDTFEPMKEFTEGELNIIMYGTEGRVPVHFTNKDGRTYDFKVHFEGVIPLLIRRYSETTSEMMREEYEKFMRRVECPVCHGKRLKPETLAVTIRDIDIADLTALSIERTYEFFKVLPGKLTEKEKLISQQILKEITNRLKFLLDVGLGYLSLDRPSETLAGGEAQRIRLATQVGSKLVGVLYVLDEPSIGLHSKDNKKLLNTLKELRDLGNTVLIVEHDEETIRNADFIVDVGPGAGVNGGYVVVTGTLDDILNEPKSLTGRYLKGDLVIPVPKNRRKGNSEHITLYGVNEHNLKHIDVKFPLHTFICITGVSGSGKSSLIQDVLWKALKKEIYKSKEEPGKYEKIEGVNFVDKVVIVDQSPIGRTPRSNPATYTGVFTPIREIFASLPESRARGYKAGRFSFNVHGGRCEACEGNGFIKVEMQFLPDVYVPCEVCRGKRYNRETLEIKYKGKSIAGVLDMTVSEALEFFENIPELKRKLSLLNDVGLGYIKLGQSALTLSGGEAQRVKLASELQKRGTGRTIYFLDEPTTGLHFADVHKLIDVLNRLVERGSTVVVIEHNFDVVKSADYIIDLGPEGGEKGGYVVATGTPEEVARNSASYTGQYLKRLLR